MIKEPIGLKWTDQELKDYHKTINKSPCLHDSCPGCKDGTCNGVHMISCNCPKCRKFC